MSVHLGMFGQQRSKTFECYIDEEMTEDYFAVGLKPLEDFWVHELKDWCEQNIGMEDDLWGHDKDEFYSPLSSGDIFWFKTDGDRLLFRMAWSPM